MVEVERPDLDRGEVVGVPHFNAPTLRLSTDRYSQAIGVDLTPDYEALNLSMAISLVSSTGGVALLPLYARDMLPPSMVIRPLEGAAPTIDLVLGYSESNHSPLLQALVSNIEALKFSVPHRP